MTAPTRTGRTTFEMPTERELVLGRVFEAPRALVFEALTSPEHLPHWMLGPDGWEMVACEVDLRPGGRWRFEWHGADGRTMELSGEYREVEPPVRLVQTESWGEDWPETLNTLVLEEDDGRTTMTQTILYPSRDARDAAAGSGMKEGVALSFDRLDALLEAIAR